MNKLLTLNHVPEDATEPLQLVPDLLLKTIPFWENGYGGRERLNLLHEFIETAREIVIPDYIGRGHAQRVTRSHTLKGGKNDVAWEWYEALFDREDKALECLPTAVAKAQALDVFRVDSHHYVAHYVGEAIADWVRYLVCLEVWKHKKYIRKDESLWSHFLASQNGSFVEAVCGNTYADVSAVKIEDEFTANALCEACLRFEIESQLERV